jgi:hypothetical protein
MTSKQKMKEMVELFNTVMGRRLIEHDIPEIHKQLSRVADALEKNSRKKERLVRWILDLPEQMLNDQLKDEIIEKIDNL